MWSQEEEGSEKLKLNVWWIGVNKKCQRTYFMYRWCLLCSTHRRNKTAAADNFGNNNWRRDSHNHTCQRSNGKRRLNPRQIVDDAVVSKNEIIKERHTTVKRKRIAYSAIKTYDTIRRVVQRETKKKAVNVADDELTRKRWNGIRTANTKKTATTRSGGHCDCVCESTRRSDDRTLAYRRTRHALRSMCARRFHSVLCVSHLIIDTTRNTFSIFFFIFF